MAAKVHVKTKVNGESLEFLCDPRQSLLECLRDILNLTGTKEGCNDGNCGACSVLLNGRLVNSCLVLGVEIEGQEGGRRSRGWPTGRGLHPLQQAFIENDGLQCGFCTPGMLMAAQGAARPQSESERRANPHLPGRQPLPAAPATTRSCAPYRWPPPACAARRPASFPIMEAPISSSPPSNTASSATRPQRRDLNRQSHGQGVVHGRHQAAGDAVRQGAAQSARARAHPLYRHSQGRGARRRQSGGDGPGYVGHRWRQGRRAQGRSKPQVLPRPLPRQR